MKQQHNTFMIGVSKACGTVLKGGSIRKVGNHCYNVCEGSLVRVPACGLVGVRGVWVCVSEVGS